MSYRYDRVIEDESHNCKKRGLMSHAANISNRWGIKKMEILYDAGEYPSPVLRMIRETGDIGIAIANWWKLGWPERVAKLLSQRIYEAEFRHQFSQVQNILARTEDMAHFSPVRCWWMADLSTQFRYRWLGRWEPMS